MLIKFRSFDKNVDFSKKCLTKGVEGVNITLAVRAQNISINISFIGFIS